MKDKPDTDSGKTEKIKTLGSRWEGTRKGGMLKKGKKVITMEDEEKQH